MFVFENSVCYKAYLTLTNFFLVQCIPRCKNFRDCRIRTCSLPPDEVTSPKDIPGFQMSHVEAVPCWQGIEFRDIWQSLCWFGRFAATRTISLSVSAIVTKCLLEPQPLPQFPFVCSMPSEPAEQTSATYARDVLKRLCVCVCGFSSPKSPVPSWRFFFYFFFHFLCFLFCTSEGCASGIQIYKHVRVCVQHNRPRASCVYVIQSKFASRRRKRKLVKQCRTIRHTIG